jgi:hypothetical protein
MADRKMGQEGKKDVGKKNGWGFLISGAFSSAQFPEFQLP